MGEPSHHLSLETPPTEWYLSHKYMHIVVKNNVDSWVVDYELVYMTTRACDQYDYSFIMYMIRASLSAQAVRV